MTTGGAVDETGTADGWLKEIRFRLIRGEFERLPSLIRNCLSASGDLSVSLAELTRVFANRGRLDVLFDSLVGAANHGARHISIYAALVKLAEMIGQTRKANNLVERARAELGVMRFATGDYLSSFGPKTTDSAIDLTALKYGSLRLTPGVNILALADSIADRLDLDETLCARLWEHSRVAGLSRDNWTAKLRRGFALDHVLEDLRFSMIRWDIERVVDMEAWGCVKHALGADGGSLAVTFHGGLLRAARVLFETVEGWQTLQTKSAPRGRRAGPGRIAASDPRSALFAALRVLQSGNVLLVAPDGPWGTRMEKIGVFGTTTAAGEGAAFLAFEARCPTIWFTVVRDDERLVPSIAKGPVRQGSEPYNKFLPRWLDFYSQQIEFALTGEPMSIALKPRWTSVLR